MVSAEDGAGFSREVLNRETSRTSRTMVVEAGEAAAAAEEVVAAAEEVEAAAEEEEVFFFSVPFDFPLIS
jgi:predicted dinucleotide-binding enzyme